MFSEQPKIRARCFAEKCTTYLPAVIGCLDGATRKGIPALDPEAGDALQRVVGLFGLEPKTKGL